MPFKATGIRAWAKEWRQSDWRETIPLSSGRECPRCLATVCGGKAWRAHDAWHDENDALFDVVQLLARALKLAAGGDSAAARGLLATLKVVGEDGQDGFANGPGGGGEDPGTASPLSGYVIGSGPLPEDMRGGGE